MTMEILRIYPKEITVALEMTISEIEKLLLYNENSALVNTQINGLGPTELQEFVIDFFSKLSEVYETVRNK